MAKTIAKRPGGTITYESFILEHKDGTLEESEAFVGLFLAGRVNELRLPSDVIVEHEGKTYGIESGSVKVSVKLIPMQGNLSEFWSETVLHTDSLAVDELVKMRVEELREERSK